MTITLTDAKRAAAAELARALEPGMRVALTTHVSPDGDGLGSEVGLVHLLQGFGIEAVIANPSPTSSRFQFLFEGLPEVDRSRDAVRVLRKADFLLVVDIADVGRLGHLRDTVAGATIPVACIDHHTSPGSLPPGPRYVDPTAAATGELVYEIARANAWPVTTAAARALYVAILTDTGGFRFSNTSPRTLRITADLLEAGVDPEGIYLDVYANTTEGRHRLLAETLETLVVEPEIGLSWVTVPPGSMERYQVGADELEGVVEYPRSISGTRMAVLFREMSQGRIKVSFRSVGTVDVAAFAKPFGGGGHVKAAGVALEGSLAEVQEKVLGAAREWLADGSGAARR